MKLSPAHLIVLAAPCLASSLVGCSVAPVSPGEGTGTSESAMQIGPVGPVPIKLYNDPLTYCTTTAPNSKFFYSTQGSGLPSGGWGSATGSCDWFVFEIENTLGGWPAPAFTDTPPDEGPDNFIPPPAGVTNAASCNASYLTYEVMGFVAPHLIVSGFSVIEVPGAWSEVGHIYGTWNTSKSRCDFPKLEMGYQNGGYGPMVVNAGNGANGSPYSTIRIATQFMLDAQAGTYWGPLYMYIN